ncbi:MAG: hypothetical protein AAB352_00305 [Patescibacteria group bacterium]
MLAKISDFVKAHFNDIILITIVFLLILLSFAIGYIMASYQNKGKIEIEQPKISINILWNTYQNT